MLNKSSDRTGDEALIEVDSYGTITLTLYTTVNGYRRSVAISMRKPSSYLPTEIYYKFFVYFVENMAYQTTDEEIHIKVDKNKNIVEVF